MPIPDFPLIWTTHGNLPVDSLEYRSGWDVTLEAITHWEEYWRGGALVKRSAHVLLRKGSAALSETAPL